MNDVYYANGNSFEVSDHQLQKLLISGDVWEQDGKYHTNINISDKDNIEHICQLVAV